MSKTHRFYSKAIRKRFGYMATWYPGKELQLGQIGTVDYNIFNNYTSLEALGMKDLEVIDEDRDSEFEWSYEDKMSILTKAAGEASPEGSSLSKADAGFYLKSEKADSIYLVAKDVRVQYISNIIPIQEKVLKLWDEGKWEKDWVIITEIMTWGSGSIIASQERDFKMDIKVNAELKTPIQAKDLAKGELKLSIKSPTTASVKLLGNEGLTPLFKGYRLQSGWFRKEKLVATRSVRGDLLAEDISSGGDMLVEADFEDLSGMA